MIWKACIVISVALCVLGDRRPATSRQRVELRISGQNGDLSHIGHQKPEHHEEYAWAYPSYEFSYEVDDPHTHDIKGQHESRDGDKVRGYYWLIQPDGHKRLVKYRADDKNGFTADVKYMKLEGHEHEINENKGGEGQNGEEGGQGNEGQGGEEPVQGEEQGQGEQQGEDEQQEQGEQESGSNNEGNSGEVREERGENQGGRNERRGRGGRGDSEQSGQRSEEGENAGVEQKSDIEKQEVQEKNEGDLWLGLRGWSKLKDDRKEHEKRQKGGNGEDTRKQEGGQGQEGRAQEREQGNQGQEGRAQEREQGSQGLEGGQGNNNRRRNYGGIWKGIENWNNEGLTNKNVRHKGQWGGNHGRISALTMIGEKNREGRGIGDKRHSGRSEERRGQSSRHQYQYKPVPYGQRLH